MNTRATVFFRSIIVTTLTLTLPLTGQCQNPEWSIHIEGLHTETLSGMCQDNEGNIYVTGRMSEGSIAGIPVGVSGAYDIYLAKFDAAGGLQWVSTAGGDVSWEPNGSESGSHVMFDSTSHSIYLCGEYKSGSGPAVFGPGLELTGQGSFLARYNTTGVCQWVRSASGGYGKTHGTDGAGNVYWYGISLAPSAGMTFHGPPNIVVPQGPAIAKYSSDGQLLWAKSIGHNIDGRIVVRGGRVYFSGGTYGSASVLLGESISHNATNGVAVVAALDTSATTNVLWRNVYHSSIQASFTDMTIVNDSMLLLAAAYRDSLFLPTGTFVGPEMEYRPFYLIVDSSGILQQAATFDVKVNNQLIAMVNDNTIYLCLIFSETFNILNTEIAANGPLNFAILQCSHDGTPIAVMHKGPLTSAWMDLLAADDNGVVVGGMFSNLIDLGGDHVLNGNNDAFVVKYATVTSVPTLKSSASGELFIYANPNNGTCRIELPEDLLYETDLVLRILDAQGRVVQQSTLRMHEDRVQLDIRAQARGTYVAEVLSGQIRYTGRIVFE